MLFHDLRYSVRSLLRSPGLTLTALLTLALGIGANTALFSLINGVLWSAPPGVRQAEELVWLNHTSERWSSFLGGFALPEYRAYRIRSDLFEGLAAFAGTPAAVSGSGLDPVRVNAEIVSDDYFSVLRMRPALGRGFLREENSTPGTHPVAVISHDLWRTRFGSDPDIIGKPVKVNGSPFTVIGVAPREFHGLADMEEPTDLWVPLMMSGQAMPVHGEFLDKPGSGMLTGVGRLRGDISLDQASRAHETIK
jgi:putative ABC transport system permease protein